MYDRRFLLVLIQTLSLPYQICIRLACASTCTIRFNHSPQYIKCLFHMLLMYQTSCDGMIIRLIAILVVAGKGLVSISAKLKFDLT